MKQWRGPILYADIWYVQRSEAEAERERLTARVAELEGLIREHVTLCGGGGQDMQRTGMLAESRKALRAALSGRAGGKGGEKQGV